MTYKNYPDPRFIITALELRDRLDDVILIDVRPGEDYATGHIKGATHFDLYLLSINNTEHAPLESFLWMLQTLFGSRGIDGSRSVVIYDHESGERAARAVWLLEFFGHTDARFLDGGLQAWRSAGFSVTNKTQTPERLEWEVQHNWDCLATRFDVKAAINDPGTLLVDTRRVSEFYGREKRALRSGTIPGAIHIEWRRHLDANGALLPGEQVSALYETHGVMPDKTVIPFCQGGYRSASTYLVLKMIGYPNVRNYIGSWWEWGNREDTKIVSP